ncbi:MAG: mercuric transport protein MerTP [Bacteroidetes bacterium]|nr:MAG: mercuric transport protein MerTP [Bacteroidota bacterium]
MNNGKLISAGVFTAIAASVCCIVPVVALVAGSGAIASSFSWIAPARPYMIGLTVALLGFAWYQKLKKPQVIDDCGCDKKPLFFQSKMFLLSVTLFAALVIAFPFYAKAFFPKKEKTSVNVEKSNIQTVELNIKGMGCEACEQEIDHEVNKLPGIVRSTVSYKNKKAVIQFDISKTTLKDITDAVNATGYKVISQSVKK